MFWAAYIVIFIAGVSIGFLFGDQHAAPAIVAFVLIGLGKYVSGKLLGWIYDSELRYVKSWRDNHPFEVQLIEHVLGDHLVHDVYKCTENGCHRIEKIWDVQPVFYKDK